MIVTVEKPNNNIFGMFRCLAPIIALRFALIKVLLTVMSNSPVESSSSQVASMFRHDAPCSKDKLLGRPEPAVCHVLYVMRDVPFLDRIIGATGGSVGRSGPGGPG